MFVFYFVCSQYTIFEKNKQIESYKAIQAGYDSHLAHNLGTIEEYQKTIDVMASTILECSEAIYTAKKMMVYMYVEGANDYMKCKDMTIPNSSACAKIRKGIEKLGEYND